MRENWDIQNDKVIALREWVKQEFGFNDEQAQLLFKQRTQLVDLPKEKLKARICDLMDLFEAEENFFKIIKAQGLGYQYAIKNSLLTLQTETVRDRFQVLKKLFDVNSQEIIHFWERHPRWMLYYSSNKTIECTKKLADSLHVSLKDIKSLFFTNPQWADKEHFSFLKRLSAVSAYFKVSRERIVDFLLCCPEYGSISAYWYEMLGVTSIVLDKPWLMQCISDFKKYRYGGYKFFSTLVEIADFIEKTFGKVERVITREYGNEGVLKCLLVSPNKKYNYYKLITLGSGYVTSKSKELPQEERLLMAMFEVAKEYEETHERSPRYEIIYHLSEVTEKSLELASTFLLVMATAVSPYKELRILKNQEALWITPALTYRKEENYNGYTLGLNRENYNVNFRQMIVLSVDEVKRIIEKKLYTDREIMLELFGDEAGLEKALLDFRRTSSIQI